MRYRIGEFAKATKLSSDTIRYYEKEGIIVTKRDKKNRRVFDDEDLNWIKFIIKLKHTGMRLKDIREYARLRHEGEHTLEQRLELLYQQSTLLSLRQKELTEHIEFLGKKITLYQQMLTEQKQTSEETLR